MDNGGAGAGAERRELAAVLPIGPPRGKEAQDIERATLLLRSLRHFLDPRDRMLVTVVSPGPTRDAARAALSGLAGDGLALEFRQDIDLAPTPRDPTTASWWTQQVIKLGFADVSPTDFYLTLDADVIAVRPFRVADLFPGGRALYHAYVATEPIWHVWIQGSTRLLGGKMDRSWWTMAATPNLYAREIVAGIRTQVERRWRQPWKELLLGVSPRIPWTEMQLYHVTAVDSGLLGRLHAISGRDVNRYLHRWTGGAWTKEEGERWTPELAFSPTDVPFHFVVCNSLTGIPARRVSDLVEPYLKTP